VHQGEAAGRYAFRVAEALRSAGFAIHLHCGGGSFKSQMKKADGSGAPVALIVGDDETAANAVSVKLLRSGFDQPPAQVRVSFDDWPNTSAIFFSPWKTTMATYDLEEQEQLDELKTWWKMYGNIVTGILVAAGARGGRLAGLELVAAAAGGAGLCRVLGAAGRDGAKDAKRARELAGELIDKYSVTSYAGMGALLAARAQVDAGDARMPGPSWPGPPRMPGTPACVTWPACAWLP
jgi:hypothetical protein